MRERGRERGERKRKRRVREDGKRTIMMPSFTIWERGMKISESKRKKKNQGRERDERRQR